MPFSNTRNRLLKTLPADVVALMAPHLHAIKLTVRQTLIVPGKPIEAICFVESGWVSLVSTLDDGAQAEVGLVGREGMVGLPLIVGVKDGFEEAFVQANGSALQMEAGVFSRMLDDAPPLRRLLLRYTEAMRNKATQLAACNGRHDIEQRLARWLLMAHDRANGDELPVTQEFLSLMLCVYRPTVTVAAGVLQRAGLIRYSRGQITVLDRAALEAASCDCYFAVKRRFDLLLST